MLKNILNQTGVNPLNKTEQSKINGGSSKASSCPGGSRPLWGLCSLDIQTGYCIGGVIITRPC